MPSLVFRGGTQTLFKMNKTKMATAGILLYGLCTAALSAADIRVTAVDLVPNTTTDANKDTAQKVSKPTFGQEYKLRVKFTAETPQTDVIGLGVPLYTDFLYFTNPMVQIPAVETGEHSALFSVKTASRDTHPWLFPVKEDFPTPICGYWVKTSWTSDLTSFDAGSNPIPSVSEPFYIPGEYERPTGGAGGGVVLAEWNGNNISGTVSADAGKTTTTFSITAGSKLRAGAFMRITRDGDPSVNEIVKVTHVSPLSETPRKATVQRGAMRASESPTIINADVKSGDKLSYLGMSIPDAHAAGLELGSELVSDNDGNLVESSIKCIGFTGETKLRVTVNGIVHQKIGDLRLELTNDWGTQYQQWKRLTVRLMDQPGNGLAVGNTPINGLVFEDVEPANPVALVPDGKGGSKINPGTYSPVEPLAIFTTTPDELLRTRRWLLRVADVQSPNVGYISSWKIEMVPVTSADEPPPSLTLN